MDDGRGALEQVADRLRQTMEASGADGYHLLHNHPSGDPTPSRADIEITRLIAGAVPGFRGHVVSGIANRSILPVFRRMFHSRNGGKLRFSVEAGTIALQRSRVRFPRLHQTQSIGGNDDAPGR